MCLNILMEKNFLRKTYKEKRDNIKNKDIKDNDLNKMVNEIENVESVNLVLSPSELSNLAIPDEMIPDDVKDIFEKGYEHITEEK